MQNNKLNKIVAKLAAGAMVVSSFASAMPASAALITSAKDTMTRVAISTAADHTVLFTLPAGTDFDATGTTDVLRVDFPESSAFTQSGTWTTAEFTVNDGTSRPVTAVAQGAGTITCTPTAGVNNVCVAIDTTAHVFTIVPDSTFTASATGATVTFTIAGSATNGVLTNPSSAASYAVAVTHCDNVAACTTAPTATNSTTVAVGIADSDQVTVTATVDPSLTFDLDVGTTTGTNSNATYTVALGTLTSGSVKSSGDGTVNMIGMDLSTNASGGAAVTVRSGSSTGLCSTSVPGDCIEHNAGGVIAAGTEDYGLCVNQVSATLTTAAFTAAAAFDADTLSSTGAADTSTTCTSSVHNTGSGTLSTTAQTIVSTTQGISAGRAEVFVKAAISAVTPAHADYTDTLTFIATGTF